MRLVGAKASIATERLSRGTSGAVLGTADNIWGCLDMMSLKRTDCLCTFAGRSNFC